MRRALALVVALAAGCAAGPQRLDSNQTLERYLAYAGEPIVQFTSINGPRWWEAVARDVIVLWNTGSEAYLVTVWDTCPQTMFQHAIRVTSGNNKISVFDKVYVGRDTCPIREIRPIDVRRMNQDRKDMRAPQ